MRVLGRGASAATSGWARLRIGAIPLAGTEMVPLPFALSSENPSPKTSRCPQRPLARNGSSARTRKVPQANTG